MNDNDNPEIDNDSLAELEGELMQAETETEPESEGPQGQDPDKYPYDPMLAQMCSTVGGVGFGIVASRRGPHWALKQEEANDLGVAAAQALAYYLPATDFGPGMKLFFVLSGITGMRVMTDVMNKNKPEEEGGDDGKD